MNNKNNLELHASAEYMLTKNDSILEKGSILANYNGENLNVMGNKNNKIILVQLTNDDIMKILAIPSSNMSLEERISVDFPIKRRRRTRRQGKKSKRATTRKRIRKRKQLKRHSVKSNKTDPTITKLLGELE